MNRKIKVIGLVLLTLLCFYVLQYISTAVHYNCAIIKDDCPPPIYASSEFIYRAIVQPFWLTHYEVLPTEFSFPDGQYSFWEGEVDGNIVVIRVRRNSSPVLHWIFEEKLPRGVKIVPASGVHIQEWLKSHPDISLTTQF